MSASLVDRHAGYRPEIDGLCAVAVGSVALAVFTAGYAILMPHDPRELGTSLIAASLFVAHIQVWQQAGCFNSRSVETPLARKEAVPQDRMEIPLDATLAREAARLTPFVAGGSQITLIDPKPLHCAANACSVLQNGRTVYFGNNHVTNQRASQMRHLFDPMLSRRESL